MTPTQIETAARRAYNASSSDFWSSSEIYDLIYFAQMDLCRRALVLERNYSTSTVASTQEYAFPDYAHSIKKISCGGFPLTLIDLKEDDQLTNFNTATTQTGTPRYYTVWNRTISLRPIPSSVQTLKIWTYDNAAPLVDSNSTLDVADKYHPDIVEYVIGNMVVKDENYELANWYLGRWENSIKKAPAAVPQPIGPAASKPAPRAAPPAKPPMVPHLLPCLWPGVV